MTRGSGRTRASLERLSTGVSALDDILNGGVPRNSITFIVGTPGSGKTVLCQQAMFANASTGNRVLYLGTRSEPVLKMIRFVQTFSFYDGAIVGREVNYADIGTALASDDGSGLLEEISRLIQEHRPSMLIIDEFRAIRERFGDSVALRDFTTELMARLAAWEVTAFIIGVYSEEEISTFSEFAVADGIIYLYGTAEVTRQKRFLRVMKMRGTDYFGGQHAFDITSKGFEVYPRLAPGLVGEYVIPTTRFPSMVDGLTKMLAGGLEDSTTLLINGGSGSGKTLVALSFLVAAAKEGKPALFISFEESAGQVTRNAAKFGWDIPGLMDRRVLGIYHVSPSELDIDKHAILIQHRAEEMNAAIIAIDAVSLIEASLDDNQKYQSFMWAILDHFKRVGVAVIMTYELNVRQEAVVIARQDSISFLADVIIQLKIVQSEGEINRTINVLKMRGNTHDRTIRELIIEDGRIAVGGISRDR